MLSYAALRDIQRKESESAALAEVDKDFYEQLAALLEQKRREAQEGQSLLAIREYENIKKVVQSIQSKREEKIALLALRGGEAHGLAHEEAALLKNLSGAIAQSRQTVRRVWENEEGMKPAIRIVKEVERYKGMNDHVYGPFKPGEELRLPKAEAEWLLKAQLAEPIV